MKQRKRPQNWRIAKRVLKEFVLAEKLRASAALACTLGAGLATAGVAAAVKPLLDFIFIQRREELLLPVTLLIVVLLVLRECAIFGQAALVNVLTRRVSTSIQLALFDRIVRSDLKFFHKRGTGKVQNRATGDVNILRSSLSVSFTSLSRDSVMAISLLGLMFYRDPVLSLITMIGLPLIIWPVRRLGRRLQEMTRERMKRVGDYGKHMFEVFTYIKTVKAYVREGIEVKETNRLLRAIEGAILKCVILLEGVAPTVQLIMGVSIVGTVFYGGQLVITGDMTPGQFFSFLTAFTWLFQPLRRLATSNVKLMEGLAAARRIYAILDSTPIIQDAPTAKPLIVKSGEIQLVGVEFRYPSSGDARSLVGVDLDMPGGKTTALVGPTGAGKSTILDLILRFYDPTEGRVLVDGQDLRSVTLSSLRSQIGYVPQEPAIFGTTLADNIRYGVPSASDDEVRRVARLVGADQFIEQSSEGYETKVGPRGTTISGGQRQLLALARAMLRDPPILLLDEPTASLDSESEKQVHAALQQLMRDRTVILVAHRLSTVTQADKICVLDGGRIVEVGKHAELLRLNGLYARLYQLQIGAIPLRA